MVVTKIESLSDLTDYERGRAVAVLDAKKRQRKKKLNCKPGQEQRGAACQDKRTKNKQKGQDNKSTRTTGNGARSQTSGKMSKALTKAVVGLAAGAAIVGAGVGVSNPNLSQKTQKVVDDALSKLKKKIPNNVKQEINFVAQNIESEFDKARGQKEPTMASQLAKEAAIWTASNGMGIVLGIGGGEAASSVFDRIKSGGKPGRNRSLLGSILGASVRGDIQRAYSQRSREYLENKYGTGIKNPETRKRFQQALNATAIATEVGIRAFGVYKEVKDTYEKYKQQENTPGSSSSTREQYLEKNWHKTIGIDPKTATEAEIKKAFRKIIMENHPDLGGDEEKMKELNEMYEYYKKNIRDSN